MSTALSPGPRGMQWILALLVVVVVHALPATGCKLQDGTTGDAGGEPARPLFVVVRRLGPADFPGAPPAPRYPIAQIGPEAREVIVGPQMVEIGTAVGVDLTTGSGTAAFDLPPAARDLPDTAFVLSVQRVPDGVQGQAAWFAQIDNFHRATDGWRIDRAGGPDEVAVHADQRALSPDEKELHHVNLRLSAMLPGPAQLDSVAFDPPTGARLEIGYGLAGGPDAATARQAVRFRADLHCAERAARTIVDDTFAEQRQGWQGAAIDLEPAETGCRLTLSARAADGSRTSGAFWAVPRILAPLPTADVASAPNVILISLDTLGATHLRPYGYRRDTTPRLDRQMFAAGTTFLDASTTYPRTDVAHLSLFASLDPASQPTLGRAEATSRIRMLAEILRDGGLRTAAFTESGLLAGALGFWFGFDEFVEQPFESSARGHVTTAAATRWIERHRDERFFLFLHTYRVHIPYEPSADYQKLFRDPAESEPNERVPENSRAQRDDYDRSIREVDDTIGNLLVRLDELGLAERSIVVILSDHGEAFGEHGVYSHGLSFHQEQLHIPLVFRGPGVPVATRVRAPVGIVDVAPTLIDMLGLPPLGEADGMSLRPAFAGAELPAARALTFSWMRTDEPEGIRQGSAKVVRSGTAYQMFDLRTDPLELHAVHDAATIARDWEPVFRERRAASAARRSRLAAPSAEARPALSEDTERALRALGYVE